MSRFRTYAVRAASLSFVAVLAGAAGSVTIENVGAGVAHGASEHLVAQPTLSASVARAPSGDGLRVVTYNIHSGLGASFSLWQSRDEVERNLREIAGDIVEASPSGEAVDVVALNEVDFGSRRSAWIDEAAFVAGELAARTGQSYDIVRGETWERRSPGREVRFGNALLVRLPIVASSECLLSSRDCDAAPPQDDLPSLRPSGLRGLLSEERGVVKATVLSNGQPVDILVTHLDAFSEELREGQAMHLLRRFVDPARSTILLGDLNAVAAPLAGKRPFFRAERTLEILTSGSLADARARYAAVGGLDSGNDWATYPAEAPVLPLDAVLASADLLPKEVAVIGTNASDHRGLAALLVPVVRNAANPSPASAGSTAS